MVAFRAVVLMLALIGSVAADKGIEVEIGAFTHHWVSEGVNNDTGLVAVSYRGFEVGTMRNSFGDRSYIAGYRFDLRRGFSLSVGAIYGYGENSIAYPVRFGETVMYPAVNYTHRLTDHLSIRARQMAEVTLISAVIQFSRLD